MDQGKTLALATALKILSAPGRVCDIAERYGITASTVRRIKQGRHGAVNAAVARKGIEKAKGSPRHYCPFRDGTYAP